MDRTGFPYVASSDTWSPSPKFSSSATSSHLCLLWHLDQLTPACSNLCNLLQKWSIVGTAECSNKGLIMLREKGLHRIGRYKRNIIQFLWQTKMYNFCNKYPAAKFCDKSPKENRFRVCFAFWLRHWLLSHRFCHYDSDHAPPRQI